jgi:hypothetical protein
MFSSTKFDYSYVIRRLVTRIPPDTVYFRSAKIGLRIEV